MPLVTVDPFFSIWSCDDALYGGPTEHWSGRPCPIMAGLYIDNSFHSVSGFDPNGKAISSRIYQTGVEVTPTSSVYHFENEYAKLTLTFTTPLLLDRLDNLTRPVSDVEYKIDSKRPDKNIRFAFGISARACVDNKTQSVSFRRTPVSLACGNVCQNPLSQSGDNVMIDWGYLHLCDREARVGRFESQRCFAVIPTNNT